MLYHPDTGLPDTRLVFTSVDIWHEIISSCGQKPFHAILRALLSLLERLDLRYGQSEEDDQHCAMSYEVRYFCFITYLHSSCPILRQIRFIFCEATSCLRYNKIYELPFLVCRRHSLLPFSFLSIYLSIYLSITLSIYLNYKRSHWSLEITRFFSMQQNSPSDCFHYTNRILLHLHLFYSRGSLRPFPKYPLSLPSIASSHL